MHHCFNPRSESLLWLDISAQDDPRPKTCFGLLPPDLQPRIGPEDPRSSVFNADGRPLTVPEENTQILHSINMLVIFSHRFMSKEKWKRVKAMARGVAAELEQDEDGEDCQDYDGRAGGGGGGKEGEGGMTGEGSESEGPPRKRTRTENGPEPSLLPSTSAEERAPEAIPETPILLDLFGELINPTDISILWDSDEDSDEDENPIRDTLLARYPRLSRGESSIAIRSYHEKVVDSAAVLCWHMMAGLAANSRLHS
ncbi:hypothetical protein C8R44DRAFT_62334 [Mycena epipterygia]|nr:hypothetical protein C8R44DRAFT_62334 [Mycena epipterygia]